MPNSQFKRAFISSAQAGLKFHRTAIGNLLGEFGFQTDMMEEFHAEDKAAVDVCKQRVQASDIFICIIGHAYGSIVPDQGKSFTHLEYEIAKQAGKPRFCFIMRKDTSISYQDIDFNEEKQAKLELFKRTVEEERIVRHFSNLNELVIEVAKAVIKWKDEAVNSQFLTSFEGYQEAYDALLAHSQKNRVSQAKFVLYFSHANSRALVEKLLYRGAKVHLLLQHPDSRDAQTCGFDRREIISSIHYYEPKIEQYPEQLTIDLYRELALYKGLVLDEALLAISWYTFKTEKNNIKVDYSHRHLLFSGMSDEFQNYSKIFESTFTRLLDNSESCQQYLERNPI